MKTSVMNDVCTYSGSNDQVIEQSKSEFSLTGAYLSGIGINWENDQLCIRLKFELLYPAGQSLMLKFTGVFEYYFNYNAANYFYYVERLKFFKAGSRYYISLDPVDEVAEINGWDNDFILADNVEAYTPIP